MSISSGPAWFSNFSFLKSSFSCHNAFFLFIKSTKLFFFPICFQAYYVYVESSRSHLKYVLSHKRLPWSPSPNQSLYDFLSLGTTYFSLQGSSLFDCMCIHQFSSVAQLCPPLCGPIGCNTPGLPVHHQLPESTQTHVHCVGDVIQPSHPLSSTSHPAFNLSQHQVRFKWVSSSHQVAKLLEFQL